MHQISIFKQLIKPLLIPMNPVDDPYTISQKETEGRSRDCPLKPRLPENVEDRERHHTTLREVGYFNIFLMSKLLKLQSTELLLREWAEKKNNPALSKSEGLKRPRITDVYGPMTVEMIRVYPKQIEKGRSEEELHEAEKAKKDHEKQNRGRLKSKVQKNVLEFLESHYPHDHSNRTSTNTERHERSSPPERMGYLALPFVRPHFNSLIDEDFKALQASQIEDLLTLRRPNTVCRLLKNEQGSTEGESSTKSDREFWDFIKVKLSKASGLKKYAKKLTIDVANRGIRREKPDSPPVLLKESIPWEKKSLTVWMK
jgi:hypothetical protein